MVQEPTGQIVTWQPWILLLLHYRQGGIKYNEGAACIFLHLQIFPRHPHNTVKPLFCTFVLKLTTVDRTGLLHCTVCCNASFICTHKLLGSVSALFTCSLLLHLKVAGEALFGCPPFPRHILCSAQFLSRQVCRESKAECGGVQSKNPSYFLQTALKSDSGLVNSSWKQQMAKKSKL